MKLVQVLVAIGFATLLCASCKFGTNLNSKDYCACKSDDDCKKGCSCLNSQSCVPNNPDDNCRPCQCKDGLPCRVGECCTEKCVDTSTDPANCGACSTTCVFQNAASSCNNGKCKIDKCDDLWDNCDGSQDNGCETPLNTLQDCGGCGKPCGQSNFVADCNDGTCQVGGCPPTWTDCNGNRMDGCECQAPRTCCGHSCCDGICWNSTDSTTCAVFYCKGNPCTGFCCDDGNGQQQCQLKLSDCAGAKAVFQCFKDSDCPKGWVCCIDWRDPTKPVMSNCVHSDQCGNISQGKTCVQPSDCNSNKCCHFGTLDALGVTGICTANNCPPFFWCGSTFCSLEALANHCCLTSITSAFCVNYACASGSQALTCMSNFDCGLNQFCCYDSQVNSSLCLNVCGTGQAQLCDPNAPAALHQCAGSCISTPITGAFDWGLCE